MKAAPDSTQAEVSVVHNFFSFLLKLWAKVPSLPPHFADVKSDTEREKVDWDKTTSLVKDDPELEPHESDPSVPATN